MKRAILVIFAVLMLFLMVACGQDETQPTQPQQCQHAYTAQMMEEPSCNADGVCIYTCDICGDSYSELVDKIDHTYTERITVEPSCAVTGTRTFTCEGCGYSYTEAVDTLPHNFYSEVITAPTCTAEGVNKLICKDCGHSETEAIGKAAHNYSGKETTAPTCTAEGVKTFTCKDCGDSYTETVAKTAHNYSEKVTTAPTCTAEGVKTLTCKACAHSYTETVAKVAHSYSGKQTKAPTCTATGEMTYTCAACRDRYTEAIAMTSHNYAGKVTTQPTCTAKGVMTYSCTGCSDSYTEAVDMVAHVYTSQVTKAATCTAEGEMTYQCTGCSDRYNEVIAKTAHDYESKIEVEATCLADGVKAYTCKHCGDRYTETIAALGHNTDKDSLCKRCGKIILDMTEEEKQVAKTIKYISNEYVTWLADRNCFAFSFNFKGKTSDYVVVPAVVEIYIENNDGQIVYSTTKILQASDFKTWKGKYGEEDNTAVIYIYVDDITQGKQDTGKIYYKVYNEGYFDCGKDSINISRLPLLPVTIVLPSTPVSYDDYYYNSGSGKWEHRNTVQISQIRYEIAELDEITIYMSGQVMDIYSNAGQSPNIKFKLVDSKGNQVTIGSVSVGYSKRGDTFTDKKTTLYLFDELEPGETYTLILEEKRK